MFDGLTEIAKRYGMKTNVAKLRLRCLARMRERRGFWWGNLRERDYLGDPGVERIIILRWIVRK